MSPIVIFAKNEDKISHALERFYKLKTETSHSSIWKTAEKKSLISLNYVGHMWITCIKNTECILCNKVVAFPQVHTIKGKRKLKEHEHTSQRKTFEAI